MTFRVLALSLALVAAGCASIDPNNVLSRQLPSRPAPESLDAEMRSEAFDFVWLTINDRYYDPQLNGVDWRATEVKFRPLALNAPNDEQFWEELDRMAGEMKDGHTRVESPRQAALRDKSTAVTFGFGLVEIDGALVVSSVNGEGDAWWAGVRNGMKVAYGLAESPTPKQALEIGAKWAPYRTVGSWYMWRAVADGRLLDRPLVAGEPGAG